LARREGENRFDKTAGQPFCAAFRLPEGRSTWRYFVQSLTLRHSRYARFAADLNKKALLREGFFIGCGKDEGAPEL
jgi:hypothetical protein